MMTAGISTLAWRRNSDSSRTRLPLASKTVRYPKTSSFHELLISNNNSRDRGRPILATSRLLLILKCLYLAHKHSILGLITDRHKGLKRENSCHRHSSPAGIKKLKMLTTIRKDQTIMLMGDYQHLKSIIHIRLQKPLVITV